MLGKINTVPLKHIWKSEPQEFTPWLAENLSEIGNAVGLELELVGIEVSAGPFSADILAKDTGTDTFVVIENQFTKTDHDHLGKCITYASVLDASAVIWVAPKFTDEHKKALDWLNDHTSDEIGFYGVKLELWKIDNSLPAVRFNVISEPNTAVRQATMRKEQGELSDSKKKQLQFWTDLREKLQKTGKVMSLHTPRGQYWYDIALGKSGIHLSNVYNTDRNEIGLRVYISNKSVPEWMPYFDENKDLIEREIGAQLLWDPNPENKDKIIALFKAYDLDNSIEREKALDWLVEEALKFRKVFSKLIKNK